jgi:hypothetical protein
MRRLLVTANFVPSSHILVILMMEALGSSETSVLPRATRRNIPEDTILQDSHRREILKPYTLMPILYAHIYTILAGLGTAERLDLSPRRDIFLFSTLCRQVLELTQLSTQMLFGFFHGSYSGLTAILTTHFQPAPTSRIPGLIHPLNHSSSRCST